LLKSIFLLLVFQLNTNTQNQKLEPISFLYEVCVCGRICNIY